MGYNSYESSEGTDYDDFVRPTQNRMSRKDTVSGNKRTAAASASMSYPMMYENPKMEAKIRQFEKEAYYSTLRAFKAQADSITSEKSGFITDMRKELRLSNEDHRELCKKVNEDVTIRRIREWRQSTGRGFGISITASRKKQKIEGSSSRTRRGKGRLGNGTSGGLVIEDVKNIDPLVGRKISTRLPGNDKFNEGMIMDYNAEKSYGPFRWGNPQGGVKGWGAKKSRSKKDRENHDEIRLLDTNVLIKEVIFGATKVETVFGANHPDSLEIEKVQRVLKDQEQGLVDAIAKLGALSDGEDDRQS
ncbi:protein EMSY-LIKE 3-like [Andrographis paniculata]|uniref:protein EMSY-LIKE 3-like n=1 Tax=Andrographis paniculata TaxID=175694 RepID=UPI0021E90B44|nr:protein EMSY-LIKE 3-like [Andrographis paniculata]